MDTINLFKTKQGEWLTNKDLLETLLKLEADKCEVLYIHSAMSFGIPNMELKTRGLMHEICKVLDELKVATLVMPTFTFSYPNGIIYDHNKSKTKMGTLNDFFRKQEGVVRSFDPLMSVAVKGKDKGLALDVTTHSIGDNSTYDMIRNRDNVKFLFLGTRIGDCFTYMHYLEWLYGVNYRYERRFVGTSIIDGKEVRNEYDLFVRYNGVTPNGNTYVYENDMYKDKLAFKANFGDSSISIVDKCPATFAYKVFLDKAPYYFVNLKDGIFNPDKTFLLENEMVAL